MARDARGKFIKGSRSSGSTSAQGVAIEGLEALLKRLEFLDKKAADRVMAAGIRAGLREETKAIKSLVPSRLKSVKKSIGSRFLRKKAKGILQAKAGAGVGKVPRTQRSGGDKLGVGISGANVHWWILGVASRVARRAKQLVGFAAGKVFWFGTKVEGTEPNPIVKAGHAKAQFGVMRKMAQTIQRGIHREAEKARKTIQ